MDGRQRGRTLDHSQIHVRQRGAAGEACVQYVPGSPVLRGPVNEMKLISF